MSQTTINFGVGPRANGGPLSPSNAGSPINGRGSADGSLVTDNGHGFYMEPALRGQLFVLDSDSVTLASANSTKGAAGTIKLVNGFYNPVNSGKNCVILWACVLTQSGTPAGGYFYNFQACPAITSASTGTVRGTILGNASAASVVTPQVNVAVTRQDAATTAFTQLATFGGPTAVAATGSVESVTDSVDGKIIVPPGTVFGIAATGAGTSHVVQSTLMWEEVSINM